MNKYQIVGFPGIPGTKMEYFSKYSLDRHHNIDSKSFKFSENKKDVFTYSDITFLSKIFQMIVREYPNSNFQIEEI